MLIRRAVLEKAGHFDADYFFFFEDVDFCSAGTRGRVRKPLRPGRAGLSRGWPVRSGRVPPVASTSRPGIICGWGRSAASTVCRGRFTAGSIVVLNTAYVLTSPDAPLSPGSRRWSGSLAPPARTLWTRPGCVARASPLDQREILDHPLDLLALSRDDHRKVERDDEHEEDQHEDEDGGRVVDPERSRGDVRARRARSRRRAAPSPQRTQRTEYSSVELAPAHQLQHERPAAPRSPRRRRSEPGQSWLRPSTIPARAPSSAPASSGECQRWRAPA